MLLCPAHSDADGFVFSSTSYLRGLGRGLEKGSVEKGNGGLFIGLLVVVTSVGWGLEVLLDRNILIEGS